MSFTWIEMKTPCLCRSPRGCRTWWWQPWTGLPQSSDAGRADVIRIAVENYLEDFDELSVAIDRLGDPNDSVLEWDQFQREPFDTE